MRPTPQPTHRAKTRQRRADARRKRRTPIEQHNPATPIEPTRGGHRDR